MMDYRKILLAYLRHVLAVEGVTFVRDDGTSGEIIRGTAIAIDLTDAERAELGRLNKLARGE